MKRKRIVSICLVVIAAVCFLTGTASAAYVKNAELGSEIWWVFQAADLDGRLWLSTGSLPNGLELGPGENSYIIHGKAQECGTFHATVSFEKKGGSVVSDELCIIIKDETSASSTTPTPNSNAGVTVVGGSPTITKHPGEDCVSEGGECIFTAYADNSDSIEWFFTKNGETVSAKDARSKYSGLRIVGADTSVIELYDVPLSMNGCKVYCVFTGSGGSVTSDSAHLYVVKPTPTPAPTPKPSLMPAPTPTPTPSPEPTPVPESPAVTDTQPEATPTVISDTPVDVPMASPEQIPETTREEAEAVNTAAKEGEGLLTRSDDSKMVVFAGALLIISMICGTVLYLILTRDKSGKK